MAKGPKPFTWTVAWIVIYAAGIVGILIFIDLDSTGGWPTTAWTVAALLSALLWMEDGDSARVLKGSY